MGLKTVRFSDNELHGLGRILDKRLANAKRPCSCSVLCIRPKSSLCSCPYGPYYGRICCFRYLLRLRRYKRKSVEVGVFRRGWVTFGEYLTGKGGSPTNQCWCRETRVMAVSFGIKISAVHHSVLSQYTHLTDRRTDGRTNGQNCDSNTVRCIRCRTVKMDP